MKYSKLFHILLLLGIIVLAAYLRLWRISEYMTFLGDEGRDVLTVKRIIVDHKFTTLGPTASVGGFFLGPAYYYFMVPFLWLWKLDPTGPAVMVALFGIATVYLVYRVGRELFGEWAGLIASALYAVSPIVIAYSRSSWNPNLVPFFSLLLVYALWQAVVHNRWFSLFWVGLFIGVGVQLHYLFLYLIPVAVAWFLLFGRSRRHLPYYILGIAGFIVGLSPFLIGEIVHHFPNIQTIIRYVLEGKDTGFNPMTFLHNIADVTFRLFGRLVLRLPEFGRWNEGVAWQLWLWLTATYAFIFTSISYLAYELRVKKGEINKKVMAAALLSIWFALCIFFFGLYKKSIYDYYLGILFPFPFILFGAILAYLAKHKLGIVAAIAITVFTLAVNWQGRPFIYPPNNQLAQAKLIAGEAFAKAQGQPFNFALITSSNSDHAYRYFFEIWGNPSMMIKTLEDDPKRQSVTDQLIVICETNDCQPLGHPLWEIAGFGRAEIVGEWHVSFVRIFKLKHYQGKI